MYISYRVRNMSQCVILSVRKPPCISLTCEKICSHICDLRDYIKPVISPEARLSQIFIERVEFYISWQILRLLIKYL